LDFARHGRLRTELKGLDIERWRVVVMPVMLLPCLVLDHDVLPSPSSVPAGQPGAHPPRGRTARADSPSGVAGRSPPGRSLCLLDGIPFRGGPELTLPLPWWNNRSIIHHTGCPRGRAARPLTSVVNNGPSPFPGIDWSARSFRPYSFEGSFRGRQKNKPLPPPRRGEVGPPLHVASGPQHAVGGRRHARARPGKTSGGRTTSAADA